MTESLAILGMGTFFLAAVPVDGDLSAWSQWGLAGIVIGYTLWRDGQREKRMSEALEKHQAWVQQTLLAALERNSVALEKFAGAFPEQGNKKS